MRLSRRIPGGSAVYDIRAGGDLSDSQRKSEGKDRSRRGVQGEGSGGHLLRFRTAAIQGHLELIS